MKYLFPLFLLLTGFLSAQTCTGNLGDNIFTEGDFGAAPPNVLLPNPGIAPDYIYNTNPPPNDGQYVVTNNTAAWTGLFPTWLAIGDNSPDPNGYMMVVNASFEPGLFYDRVIDELCENTLYEFSADIINLIQVGVADHLDPNVSFLLDDVVQFTTGEIEASNEWQTYGFTFTTAPGQTSIRLSLRNNAPGGIGNDLALDNISFRTCGDDASILPDEVANICEDGDPLTLFATVEGDLYDNPAIQWQVSPDGVTDWTDIPGATGTTYEHNILSAGQYFYRFLLANGPVNLQNEKCRINSNVKTVVVLPKEFFQVDTICTGLTYPVGNALYSETGNYTDSLLNSFGCDSIVFTDLTVLPQPDIQPIFAINSPACFDAEDGAITVSSVLNGSPPYAFNWADGLSTTNTLMDVLGNNSYDLQITDRYGCQLDTSVFLPGPGSLSVDLGLDQTIELGDQVNITANATFPVANYFWSSSNPNEVLPCTAAPDCPQIIWQATQDQFIYLTAADETGCTVTDSVFIAVTPIYDLYIPNVFSPNQDGVNDYFTVYGKASRVVQINSLTVFNRWGQLVYQQEGLSLGASGQGWDGRSKGKIAEQGVYVYNIEVLFLDGTVREFSGDITLLR